MSGDSLLQLGADMNADSVSIAAIEFVTGWCYTVGVPPTLKVSTNILLLVSSLLLYNKVRLPFCGLSAYGI